MKNKVFQASEKIEAGDLIYVNDDNEIVKATAYQVNEFFNEEQLVDELVDYCELSAMDNVLEIIKESVKHAQEKTIRELRVPFKHSHACQSLNYNNDCNCEYKIYNAAVELQRGKEKEFRKNANL